MARANVIKALFRKEFLIRSTSPATIFGQIGAPLAVIIVAFIIHMTGRSTEKKEDRVIRERGIAIYIDQKEKVLELTDDQFANLSTMQTCVPGKLLTIFTSIGKGAELKMQDELIAIIDQRKFYAFTKKLYGFEERLIDGFVGVNVTYSHNGRNTTEIPQGSLYFEYNVEGTSEEYVNYHLLGAHRQLLVMLYLNYVRQVDKTWQLPVPFVNLMLHAVPMNKSQRHTINTWAVAVSISATLSLVVMCYRILEEKDSKVQQLMKLAGVSMFEYLASFFIADFLILLLLVLVSFGTFGFFGYVNWLSYLVFLLFYIVTAIAYTFSVATIVQKANTGCVVYLILSSFTWTTPFLLGKHNRVMEFTNFNGKVLIPDWTHYILCIFSPPYYALEMGLTLLQETGTIQRETLKDDSSIWPWQFFTATKHQTFLTPGTVLIAMVLSSFFWSAVAYLIYRKPFSFFRKTRSVTTTMKDVTVSEQHFENLSHGSRVGIETDSVTKSYNEAGLVLKGVSWKVYYGELTVLLGHNGAGKTTLINIITGMENQSSGKVNINGYDKDQQPSLARKGVALCPQHNVLFDRLTVWDHLELFGRFKGLRAPAVFEEVYRVAELVNLLDKSEVFARDLSGGMKRRLQIGMAVVGDSKILILDEPSSGLDIESRRSIWRLLLSLKENYLILLTTHYMEEADFLSDRIAIMHEGTIKCCGSSMFLKKRFNVSYHIRVAKMNGFNAQKFLELCRTYLKSVQLAKQSKAEVWYNFLPEEKRSLAGLFESIELREKDLFIESCGIISPSLEDVFIKVGTMSVKKLGVDLKPKVPTVNNPRLFTQIGALMAKNFHVLKRGKSALFLLLYVQVISLALLVSVIRIDRFSTPSDAFDYNSVPGANARCEKSKLCDVFTDNFEAMGLSVNNGGTTMFTVRIEESNSRLCVHVEPKQEVDLRLLTVTFDGLVNLLENVTGQNFGDFSFTVRPKRVIHLKPTFAGTNIAAANFQSYLVFIVAMLISLALYITPIRLVLKEKATKVRLLQEMTGVTQSTYWTSCILSCLPIALLICTLFVVTVCVAFAFGVVLFFDTVYDSVTFFIVLLVTGPTTIIYAYGCTHAFNSTTAGLFFVLTFTTIISFLEYVMTKMLASRDVKWAWFLFVAISSHNPSFAFGYTLDMLAEYFLDRYICGFLFADFPESCRRLRPVMTACGQYFPDAELDWKEKIEPPTLETVSSCCDEGFAEKNVFTCDNGKYFFHNKCCNGLAPKRFTVSSHLFLLFPMLSCNFFSTFYALISTKEHCWTGQFTRKHILSQMRQKLFKVSPKLDAVHKEDVDVHNLRLSTEKLFMNNLQSTKAFCVKDLTKMFKSKVAVERLTFHIDQRTCFGLLGVNGAGKTTALRMLVGELTPNLGEAYAGQWSSVKQLQKYRTQIGYCPQFNSFVDNMTGEEMLYLFARLRGVPFPELKTTVEDVIKSVKLEQYAKRVVDNYSGGNKRKLAVAISMIGFPKLIFLDEPTTAIDPIARRQIWSAVENAKTSAGSSIILTSHTMEEVEALCDVVAIMAAGSCKCYGSGQHLAKKFGQGYLITFKFDSPVDDKVIKKLEEIVEKHLPDAQAVDSYKALAQFHVPLKSYKKSKLYKAVDAVIVEHGSGDYDIKETNLEDIFLRFARREYKGDEEVSVESVQLGIKE